MLRFVSQILPSMRGWGKRRRKPRPAEAHSTQTPPLSGDVKKLLQQIKESVGESDDVVVREFLIAGRNPAAVVFVDSLIEKRAVAEDILNVLMHESRRDPEHERQVDIRRVVDKLAIPLAQTQEVQSVGDIEESILEGDTVLMIEGVKTAWAFDTKGFEFRAVGESKGEPAVRGAREGFAEPLGVNISLIRRRLKDPNLRFKTRVIGERTKTQVALCYIEGLTNKEIVKTAKARMDAIKTDAIIESRDIESYVHGYPYSLFPLTRITTRPDMCVRYLLDGRVVFLTDNTPWAIVVPSVLQDFFITAEDYAHTFYQTIIVRWIRVIAALTAPFLPGFYIALTAVHPELIPTELALSIAGSREGLPFPTVMEVVMMELVMEILREATIRMPREMGNTIGIVGGFVIGTAAAQAGIISNLMVIIVALTAVATFVPPSFEISIPLRLSRWFFAVTAAISGLYGMTIGITLILTHLCSISSYGIAYLTPVSPLRSSILSDSLLGRVPTPEARKRPGWLRPQDTESRSPYLQPRKGPQMDDGD